ncbi:hypothetical protein [Amycolatopsis sp.]|uniref:hypothetical protein n=1 Tax=Amycolatopsis sp. TaxID=37632 RepID=UPI002C889406|nr:hypothetical protein [Amycolatopsis sp.]HVV07901.1 hypothetical protein [Amycolatopsis sp.]
MSPAAVAGAGTALRDADRLTAALSAGGGLQAYESEMIDADGEDHNREDHPGPGRCTVT